MSITLALVQALRMLGMFMILPVFAPYAQQLPGGVTPLQIGLALGLFCLVQAFLQLPFGMASDRYGRKPVIVVGLLIFAAGSAIAAVSNDIGWIMLGRSIQGAGAISGAVSAMLADATRVEVRTQAMAIFGAGVAVSFLAALVLGPLFSGWIGVDGVFALTGWLALAAVPVVMTLPAVAVAPRHRASLASALGDRELLRLDAGVFLLNATMTALFAVLPFALAQATGMEAGRHWRVYLPVLLAAALPVLAGLKHSRRQAQASPATRVPLFGAAVLLLGVSLGLSTVAHASTAGLIVALWLYFIAFSYLSAVLPSMISLRAAPGTSGSAMGVFTTLQVLGAAAGNIAGGFVHARGGIEATLLLGALLAAAWLPLLRGQAFTRQLLPQMGEVKSGSSLQGESSSG